MVVLHGIARTKRHMKWVASYLAKDFDVINLSYPSTKFTIEELTQIINKEITSNITQDHKKIHFVGYSLGGLMVRALIHKYSYDNLGRVVQIAPPNNGSEIADLVKNFRPFQKLFGPAGQKLITDQSKFGHIFGEVNYELGIIAGNFSIDPISSIFLPGSNDGKVSVESTKLPKMKDHVIIRVAHTLFPFSRKTHKHVLHFLLHGKFDK